MAYKFTRLLVGDTVIASNANFAIHRLREITSGAWVIHSQTLVKPYITASQFDSAKYGLATDTSKTLATFTCDGMYLSEYGTTKFDTVNIVVTRNKWGDYMLNINAYRDGTAVHTIARWQPASSTAYEKEEYVMPGTDIFENINIPTTYRDDVMAWLEANATKQ